MTDLALISSMFPKRAFRLAAAAVVAACVMQGAGAQRRLVLIDQDGSGPGGSNQMAMMVLLQSPQADVLGITMVTGDPWRDEEAEHTLRMLELIGRRICRWHWAQCFRWSERRGRDARLTAWWDRWPGWGRGGGKGRGPPVDAPRGRAGRGCPARGVPPMPEGAPHTRRLTRTRRTF